MFWSQRQKSTEVEVAEGEEADRSLAGPTHTADNLSLSQRDLAWMMGQGLAALLASTSI